MAKRKQLTEEEKRRKALVKELLEVSSVKTGEDINDLMKEFIAEMVGGVLEGERDDHLGYDKYDTDNKKTTNSRNGYGEKTLQTTYGEAQVKVPRDRDGEYDPVILKKYQKTVNAGIENKIISMYAKGMTTADMEDHIKEMYGLEISDSTICVFRRIRTPKPETSGQRSGNIRTPVSFFHSMLAPYVFQVL